MSAEITTLADGRTMITAWIDHKLSHEALLDTIADTIKEAKGLIAERFWKENEAAIMAKMDMQGLANLIALHASEALKPK